MNRLSKDRFKQLTGGSSNIPDHIFESSLTHVMRIDLPPVIGKPCVDAIAEIDIDTEGTPQDTTPELRAFYKGYAEECIAWMLYIRLVPVHGMNWTANGITRFKDGGNTAEGISNADRQTMMSMGRKNSAFFLEEMRGEFHAKNCTFDGILYPLDGGKFNTTTKSAPGGISAIGKPKYITHRRL